MERKFLLQQTSNLMRKPVVSLRLQWAIAIKMLLPELTKRGIKPDFLVSCWTDVYIKAMFLRQYLETLSSIEFKIYTGISTDKVYDVKSMVKSEPRHWCPYTNWQHMYWEYSLIVQLAPVNEWMHLYSSRSKFDKTKLALYASFNVRSAKSTYDTKEQTLEKVLELLGSFQQVVYYESFLATSPTIVQEQEVLSTICKDSAINAYISLWNEMMYKEVKDSNSDVSKRIAASIETCPKQFVHADTGLILTLVMPLSEVKNSLMTGKLSYAPKTHYSIFTDLVPAVITTDKMIVVTSTDKKEELFQAHMKHIVTYF